MGTFRCEHNSMKCAPFIADSENSTPLLPITPTVCPYNLENPQTRVSPYFFLNSSNLDPSKILAIISLTSMDFVKSSSAIPYSSSGSYNGDS